MKLVITPLTLVAVVVAALTASAQPVRIERLLDEPIIRPNMDDAMGSNIAGPTHIRLPE